METDTKMLIAEYDRFLHTYTEDSTLRVSREAFEKILGLVRDIELKYAAPCPNCGREHPIIRLVYTRIEKEDDRFKAVSYDVRTGEFKWISKTRKEAVHEMNARFLSGTPDPIKVLFMALHHIHPQPITLEGLAGENIRPFHMVRFLRTNMERADFMQTVEEKATQTSGDA